MKKLVLASALTATLAVSTAVVAQQPAPPKSPWTATANINLVSDYRFRGITQTWGKPAVQGGADIAHDSGFFAGTWASNVSGNEYPGGSMEWDFYGGWNFKLSDDVTIPLGMIYYYYPGSNFDKTACPSAANAGILSPCGPDVTPNNFELNAGITWKWLSFKASVALTNYFGADSSLGFTGDTSGTQYYDLGANYPVNDNLTLNAHVGYTNFTKDYNGPNGTVNPSYWDWKLGATYVFTGGWTVGAYYVQASNDTYWRPPVGGLSFANSDTKNLNGATAILLLGRTF
jgi:uncharacterized protein (TIGR02001 family)